MWQKLVGSSEAHSPRELLDSMKRLSINDFNHVLYDKAANLVFENDAVSLDNNGNIHVASPDGTEHLGHIPDYGGAGKSGAGLDWHETVDAEGKTVDTAEVGRGLLNELPRGARAVSYDYDGDGRPDTVVITDAKGHQFRFDSEKYPNVGSEITSHFLQRVNNEIHDLREAGVMAEATLPQTSAGTGKEALATALGDDSTPQHEHQVTSPLTESQQPAVVPSSGAKPAALGAAELVGSVRGGQSAETQQELIHRIFGQKSSVPEGTVPIDFVDITGHEVNSENFFGLAEDEKHILWYDGASVKTLELPEGVHVRVEAASALVPENVTGPAIAVRLDYGSREISGAVLVDPKLGPLFMENEALSNEEPISFMEAINRLISGSKIIQERAAIFEAGVPVGTSSAEVGVPAGTSTAEVGLPASTSAAEIGVPTGTSTVEVGVPAGTSAASEAVQAEKGELSTGEVEQTLSEVSLESVDPASLPHLPDGWRVELSVAPDGVATRVDFYGPNGAHSFLPNLNKQHSTPELLHRADRLLEGREGPVNE